MRRVADAFSRAAVVIRRIIGAPDYDGYVAHVRRMHPSTTPMSRDEFTREAMRRRYGKNASRCC
jgi:uncharacterized short protein YbdD (DUF466 family)